MGEADIGRRGHANLVDVAGRPVVQPVSEPRRVAATHPPVSSQLPACRVSCQLAPVPTQPPSQPCSPEDVVGDLLVQVRVRLVNHDVQQVKAAGREGREGGR